MEWWVEKWWVAAFYDRDKVMLLSLLLWVPLSICLHELGHGFAALWEGDDTPRRLNRMTLNPLVHMGGFSLVMFALVGIAWGVMPVNPRAFRHRYGAALVAAAGPAVNLMLSVVTLSIFAILVHMQLDGVWAQRAQTFFSAAGTINILLLLLNLLPIPPLDGAGVLESLSARARTFYAQPAVQSYGMLVVLVVFFSGGMDHLFSAKDVLLRSFLRHCWGIELER